MKRADVLFFNNLWTDLATVERYLPRSQYLWGFPVAGGGFTTSGLEAALLDEVRLGEMDGRETERLKRVADVFAAGLKPDVRENMLHWLWIHFAVEASIVGTAIKVGSAQAFLDDTGNIEAGILAVRETFEVVKARGVDVEAAPDAAAFYAPVDLAAQGIQAFYAANRPARKIMEYHNGIEELKRLYYDVLATGEQLGVAMPRFRALKQYVDRA